MKRILVTGASGFIGQAVLRELRGRGDEIHTVQRSALRSTEAQTHAVDLMKSDEICSLMQQVRPTHLIHLAWYAEHGKFWTSPLNLDWVAASLALFRAFVSCGGQRVVFAGSCAEYDWTHSPLNENTSPLAPNTLYGVCKNSLRQIVEKFAAETSVSFAWGRVFFLYGAGEHPNRLIPSILQPLLRDQPAVVLSGAHVRNLMHVDDVARAFVHLLDSPATGAVNIAAGEAVSLGDIAILLGQMTGKTHLLRIEQANGTPQNPQKLTADTSKLLSLNFHPKYSLEAGLRTILKATK